MLTQEEDVEIHALRKQGWSISGLSDSRCNCRWHVLVVGGEDAAFEGDGEGVEGAFLSVHPVFSSTTHRGRPAPPSSRARSTSSSASCLSSGDLAVGSFDSVTACPFSQPNQRVSISGQQAVTPDF